MEIENSGWGQWATKHSEQEQLKRQISATGSKITPISINTEKFSAVFKGSSGEYSTTLSSCSCADFSRRMLPCKHMYRLAYELGLICLPKKVASLEAAPYNKAEALKIILSSLSKDEQIIFKDFCYVCGNNNSGEMLLSNEFANKLIKCGLACPVEKVETLLAHLPMNKVREYLPSGAKSPRKKADLITIIHRFFPHLSITSEVPQTRMNTGFFFSSW